MSDPSAAAWNRVYDKYSPSSNVKQSPAIITQGKLGPFDLYQGLTTGLSWQLNANEEYYYQNVIELLTINRKGSTNTNILIRKNRIDMNWSEMLINFRILGQGSFGTVYLATDKITDQSYAVKQIKIKEHAMLLQVADAIVERDSHFRANESPFIVKLLGAFQNLISFWLVFEQCLGDLSVYINAIKIEATTFMDMFLTRDVLTTVNQFYELGMGISLERIGIIYSFELLAGLDYMANRNLVHRDLKPDNVLVSATGHLKIADLGLAQRLRWIDRHSTVDMVAANDLKALSTEDVRKRFGGNLKYADPEAIIHYGIVMDDRSIYHKIKSDYFPIKNGEQNFLSDLYAVALIIMELLFAGLNFVNTTKFTVDLKNRFNIDSYNGSRDLFGVRCLYDADVHINYLTKILNNQISEQNRGLMEFLKSALKPREIRGRGFTKRLRQLELKNVVTHICIDIEKIEELALFKTVRLTHYNVSGVAMPPILGNIYRKKLPRIIAHDMLDLLTDDDVEENGPKEVFPIQHYNYAR